MPFFGLTLDASKSDEVSILSIDERGLAPAVAKARISSYNGIILVYLFVISAIFGCHVFSKPRIIHTEETL